MNGVSARISEPGRFDALLAHFHDRLTHVEHVPARTGVIEEWPESISAPVREVFAARGITALWGHQGEALRHLAAERDVIVTTGTASGKSLIYQAHALDTLLRGRSGDALSGHRRPTVLYVSPTKALAADQIRRVPQVDSVRPATVDGDNSREDRMWARDHANWLLTNPDTLHHVLLPGHERWRRLFRGLDLVVIDECHHYRGVFGSHVANILRRLRRVAAHHGAEPRFVLCSATVAEPEAFATTLIGREAVAVTEDGSPAPRRTIALWEPPLVPTKDGREVRRSSADEASRLLAELTRRDVRSLAFVRSRRGAEQIAMATRDLVTESHSGTPAESRAAELVATYRGGYLPEERRALERSLRSGEIRAMTATSALELGIDVSGLDAVVSVGFPGTRASLWQQFGRAGRDGTDALGVFIARDEPIDHHLVRHTETLFGAPVEATVLDPQNPYIVGPHVAAAAAELPLTEADTQYFGPRTVEAAEALTKAGMLRKRPTGWFWVRRERASDLADVRSSGGRPVSIVDPSTGRLVGTVDAAAADREVHEGSVYVHQGETFLVREYHPEDAEALVEPAEPQFSTHALSSSTVTITNQRAEHHWGDVTVAFGDVQVESQVTGYLSREARTGRHLGEAPLDLPVRTLATTSVWWSVPGDVVESVMERDAVAGAAHGAEHASIGLLPLLATCDRWDIGGVSTAFHADTGGVTVFVHDAHPGGAGFAERGFSQIEQWLRLTRDVISACACTDGCPACIVSPKCGNGNQPLDKAGAVALLGLVLGAAAEHA